MESQRISADGNLPLAGIRKENHLVPQNKKAALPPIHFPSSNFPVLGLCVHVTTSAESSNIIMLIAQVTY